MGCDIHIVFERRFTPTGPWVGVVSVDALRMDSRPPCDNRNYAFFARLAGVRGDGPKALGLPDDAGELARFLAASWDGDGHSHSYVPLAAFVDAYNHSGFGDKTTSEGPGHVTGLYIDDITHWRAVFWFDN